METPCNSNDFFKNKRILLPVQVIVVVNRKHFQFSSTRFTAFISSLVMETMGTLKKNLKVLHFNDFFF